MRPKYLTGKWPSWPCFWRLPAARGEWRQGEKEAAAAAAAAPSARFLPPPPASPLRVRAPPGVASLHLWAAGTYVRGEPHASLSPLGMDAGGEKCGDAAAEGGDLYAVLGLKKECSEAELKVAYRKLAKVRAIQFLISHRLSVAGCCSISFLVCVSSIVCFAGVVVDL